jgi:hypothetical protein
MLPSSDAAGAFGGLPDDTGESRWTREHRVLRAFKIPPLVLLVTVLALAVGELASGTELYFVAMMAITLCSIGITYNMLGGLSRVSGFMFAGMAAQRIVISQFAKVLLFEPADHNLLVPNLTITVYAVFFLSLMVGVFVFAGARLRLPRPWEPMTGSQARLLYFVSLIVGVIASAVFYIDEFGTVQDQTTTGHSIGLAFSGLLLFSIVLAVDDRIRRTGGRHSLGMGMIVSSLVLAFFSFIATSRTGAIEPVAIYFLACYVRGYRLRKRHFIAGAICVVLFQILISPFALYSRGLMAGLSFQQRLAKGRELLDSPPSWSTLQFTQLSAQMQSGRDEYYSAPGTFVLSRLSLIRADSNLIAACANGFHYGFGPLKTDLLRNIPRFLYRNKPVMPSAFYIEGVIGSDKDKPGFWSYSSIADAFGAFGWIGVVMFPLFVLPAVFVVYDSMFDMTRPWGTVAVVIAALSGGATMSNTLVLLTKTPLSLWMLSVLTVGISRVVTGSGERRGSARRLGSRNNSDTVPRFPPAGSLS